MSSCCWTEPEGTANWIATLTPPEFSSRSQQRAGSLNDFLLTRACNRRVRNHLKQGAGQLGFEAGKMKVRKVPARLARPGISGASATPIRAGDHSPAGRKHRGFNTLQTVVDCRCRRGNLPIYSLFVSRTQSKIKCRRGPEGACGNVLVKPGQFQNGKAKNCLQLPPSAQSKMVFMRQSYCFAHCGGLRGPCLLRNFKSGRIPILGIATTLGQWRGAYSTQKALHPWPAGQKTSRNCGVG